MNDKVRFWIAGIIYFALFSASATVFSSGSGCAISSNLVLTAYHVVEKASKISVAFAEMTSSAEIVDANPSADWAILKTLRRLPCTVRLAPPNRRCEIGDKVYTLGYPTMDLLGSGIKYSEGTISSTTGIGGDKRLMQISAPIQPGNSGGPLFSANGDLIGIITATVDPDKFKQITNGAIPQNINFALRVEAVKSKKALFSAVRGTHSLKSNEMATCSIIAACKTEIPNIKEHLPSLEKQEPTDSGNEADEEFGEDVTKIMEKKITNAEPYQQIIDYLKGFRPIMCRMESDDWGPVKTESEYLFQASQLDDLMLKALDLYEKYADPPGSPFDEGLAWSKTSPSDVKEYWSAARRRLAEYYTSILNPRGLSMPDSLLGISLGKPYKPSENSPAKNKTIWARIKEKIRSVQQSSDFVIQGYAYNNELVNSQVVYLPSSRKFFGCNRAVTFDDKVTGNVLAIIFYVDLKEPFFNPVPSRLHSVFNTFESKFNFRLYPVIDIRGWWTGNDDSIGKRPNSPCTEPIPCSVEEYDSQKHYVTNQASSKAPFLRQFCHCYESDGKIIEMRSYLQGDEEPNAVLEVQYYLKNWREIAKQSLTKLQNEARKPKPISDVSKEDINAL